MIRSLSFKADPPPLFHTYNYHLKKAIKEGYNETPQNAEVRTEIIMQVLSGLTELFEIPENYNLILLERNKLMVEMLASKDIREKSVVIQDIDPETGRKINLDYLKESLDLSILSFLHLDISLSSPTNALDYENFQSFSFKTKYGFGMDQDLFIWIIREDLLEILTEKYSGSFLEFNPGISASKKCILQHDLQIHRIYILGKIIQDFLNRGLKIIRNEIKYKSIILYNAISNNQNLDPVIKDNHQQSQNILCAQTDIPREEIFDFMARNRIEFDVLAGSDPKSKIRFANYPVHSKEQMEFLADLIEKF